MSETTPVVRETADALSASHCDQVEMLAQELRGCWRLGQRVGLEALGMASRTSLRMTSNCSI